MSPSSAIGNQHGDYFARRDLAPTGGPHLAYRARRRGAQLHLPLHGFDHRNPFSPPPPPPPPPPARPPRAQAPPSPPSRPTRATNACCRGPDSIRHHTPCHAREPEGGPARRAGPAPPPPGRVPRR